MAKLGEEKLGSFQFSLPAPFVPDTEEVRERAEENIKSPYPTHTGTNWDKFLRTILIESELMNEVTADIFDQRFVASATQAQLNMIGEFLGVERRLGESDELYRARVKLQLPRHITDTTNDFIRAVMAQLLGTDRARIRMVESHTPRLPSNWSDMDEEEQDDWIDAFNEGAQEPARFDVFIEDIVMASADLGEEDLVELVQDIKAAGVKAGITIGNQFTYRGVDAEETPHVIDENNPDKAYGGYDDTTIDDYTRAEDEPLAEPIIIADHPNAQYDPDLGAPYADEVTARFG